MLYVPPTTPPGSARICAATQVRVSIDDFHLDLVLRFPGTAVRFTDTSEWITSSSHALGKCTAVFSRCVKCTVRLERPYWANWLRFARVSYVRATHSDRYMYKCTYGAGTKKCCWGMNYKYTNWPMTKLYLPKLNPAILILLNSLMIADCVNRSFIHVFTQKHLNPVFFRDIKNILVHLNTCMKCILSVPS